MFTRDTDNDDQRRDFSRRALILGAGQIAALGALGGRLWHLQVTEENRYALLADENRISMQVLAPERGRILDRYGEVLAANRESYRAVLTPSLARDVRGVLGRFARIVRIAEPEIERLAQRSRRQSPNTPIVIAQDLTFNQIAIINLQAPRLPGISTELAPKRQYFFGPSMGHIVGYVGANERMAMDDDPVMRLPGMRTGKTGAERGMEKALRGSGGLVRSEIDSRGRIVRHLDRVEPHKGGDIALTIDTALQGEVMARLAQYRRAVSVVMDVTNGEVLVLASVPTFDPNDVVNGSTKRVWNRLQTERDDPMTNRATRGLYPPGSTFKMVTALAAADAGHIDLKEKIACDGRYDYYDQTYRCWSRSGHGACDFHRALKESCDCYFYEIARRTGIEGIATTARKLGLGQTYPCGLSNLKSGLIPDPDWKRGRFNKGWLGGETILAGIGQGYVLTTPLQLAVMTARLASGRQVTPTVVRNADGSPPPIAPLLSTRADWLAAIRRSMIAVVSEDGGTGSKARPESGDYRVAGKTGTSQVGRQSSETAQLDLPWHLRDHALFVCYAPIEKPRYAVVTIVEHGGGGGSVAAPLARDVLAMVMKRDPLAKPAWPNVPPPAASPPATTSPVSSAARRAEGRGG